MNIGYALVASDPSSWDTEPVPQSTPAAHRAAAAWSPTERTASHRGFPAAGLRRQAARWATCRGGGTIATAHGA